MASDEQIRTVLARFKDRYGHPPKATHEVEAMAARIAELEDALSGLVKPSTGEHPTLDNGMIVAVLDGKLVTAGAVLRARDVLAKGDK